MPPKLIPTRSGNPTADLERQVGRICDNATVAQEFVKVERRPENQQLTDTSQMYSPRKSLIRRRAFSIPDTLLATAIVPEALSAARSRPKRR